MKATFQPAQSVTHLTKKGTEARRVRGHDMTTALQTLMGDGIYRKGGYLFLCRSGRCPLLPFLLLHQPPSTNTSLNTQEPTHSNSLTYIND